MVNLDRRKRARIAAIEAIEDDDGPSTSPSTSTHVISDVQTAPKAFLCPLTLAIMFDPVQDGEGNSFERHAITKWLRENSISPISRKPLHDGMLIPNNSLRELIHDYMGREWVNRKVIETKRIAEENTAGRELEPPVCPYRTKVNKLLESATSREAGVLRLRLNEHGSTAFRYEHIVVVLDVPQKAGIFHLYTRELILDPTEEMKDRLLELNFLQGETRGGCLSIKRHSNGTSEVVFSYNDRVDEVSYSDFRNILLNFVETSLTLRRKLLVNGFDRVAHKTESGLTIS